jgi:sugar phosphate isomerase/epimerase
MQLGICIDIDNLNAAKAAGFDYAEMGCHTLMADKGEADFSPVRKKLLASPLPIEAFNVFVPGALKVTGPDVNLAAVGAHMETVLRRASEVGAKIMVFGSGGARTAPDGWPVEKARAQFVLAARLAGETAARHGVTVALEPLFKKACNFFNRTGQGIAFVDEVAHPNLRLLTDLYHMAWENEPFENLILAGPRLAHMHVATPTLPETGTDDGPGYDLPRFLAVLGKTGYRGRISVEDNPKLLAKSGLPLETVYTAVRRHVADAVKSVGRV